MALLPQSSARVASGGETVRQAGPRASRAAPRRDGRKRDNHAGHVLDALSLGIIVVQQDHLVLHLNRAAGIVLQRRDALVVQKARLSCLASPALQLLTSAIGAATGLDDPSAGAFLLERPGNRAPYQVSVAPGEEAGTALVMFQDPDMEDPSLPGRLRALYALTAAEAGLALALSRGASISEIARQRGVSPGTVRGQIKSVAAKMRCRRQAEIAATIAGLPQLAAAP